MSDWVDIGSYFLHANSGHYPFGEPHNLGEQMGGFYTDDIVYMALMWECDHTLWPAGNTISRIKITVTNRSSFTATDWIWCFHGGDFDDITLQREVFVCDTTSELEFILDLGVQCDPTVFGEGAYGNFWMHCNACGSYGTNFTITSVEAQGEGSLFAPASPASPSLFWTSFIGTTEVTPVGCGAEAGAGGSVFVQGLWEWDVVGNPNKEWQDCEPIPQYHEYGNVHVLFSPVIESSLFNPEVFTLDVGSWVEVDIEIWDYEGGNEDLYCPRLFVGGAINPGNEWSSAWHHTLHMLSSTLESGSTFTYRIEIESAFEHPTPFAVALAIDIWLPRKRMSVHDIRCSNGPISGTKASAVCGWSGYYAI